MWPTEQFEFEAPDLNLTEKNREDVKYRNLLRSLCEIEFSTLSANADIPHYLLCPKVFHFFSCFAWLTTNVVFVGKQRISFL